MCVERIQKTEENSDPRVLKINTGPEQHSALK